jgi:hypothetical protein
LALPFGYAAFLDFSFDDTHIQTLPKSNSIEIKYFLAVHGCRVQRLGKASGKNPV